jgi:hypothetical protein
MSAGEGEDFPAGKKAASAPGGARGKGGSSLAVKGWREEEAVFSSPCSDHHRVLGRPGAARIPIAIGTITRAQAQRAWHIKISAGELEWPR